MDKSKINVLIPDLGRINTQNRDGSTIRLINLLKILSRQDFYIHLVLPSREEKIFKREGVKVEYHSLKEIIKYEGENLFLILLIYFIRVIKMLFFTPPKSIDIVYIPSQYLVDLLPGFWWKRRFPQAKIVVCYFLLHPSIFKGYCYAYQKKYSFPSLRLLLAFLNQKISFWLIKKRVDCILVLNQLDKKFIEKQGFMSKVNVVNMGVDLKTYSSPSLVKKYDACFIGRFHPQKGIFDLVSIWQKVCQVLPKAKLVLIGGGAQAAKNRFLKMIKRKKMKKNIIFLGFKTGKEKIKILRKSQIFLFPSHYESWGMVALEAMAAGVPVIAYNLPVYATIFRQGMIKVPLGNKSAFACQAINLLKDKFLYTKIKKEALKQAKEYSWQKIASREARILTNIFN